MPYYALCSVMLLELYIDVTRQSIYYRWIELSFSSIITAMSGPQWRKRKKERDVSGQIHVKRAIKYHILV